MYLIGRKIRYRSRILPAVNHRNPRKVHGPWENWRAAGSTRGWNHNYIGWLIYIDDNRTLKWDTMCMKVYCSPESAGQFGPSADPAAAATRTSGVINCIGIVYNQPWVDLFPRTHSMNLPITPSEGYTWIFPRIRRTKRFQFTHSQWVKIVSRQKVDSRKIQKITQKNSPFIQNSIRFLVISSNTFVSREP